MNTKPIEHEKPRKALGERTGVKTFDNGRIHYADISAHLEDFKAYFLSEYGLALVGEIIADGKTRYLGTAEDKRGHKPIRYTVHLDEPANIYFNDLKRGFHGTWYPESQQPLSPAEREARWRKIEQHKAEREAETQARHLKRAAWAVKLWNSALPADGLHAYLIRKGVGAYGLRLLTYWERRVYQDNGDGSQFKVIPIENVLVVPMKDETPLCQDRCRLPQGEFLAYSGGDQEENDDNLSKRIQSQDHCTDAAAA